MRGLRRRLRWNEIFFCVSFRFASLRFASLRVRVRVGGLGGGGVYITVSPHLGIRSVWRTYTYIHRSRTGFRGLAVISGVILEHGWMDEWMDGLDGWMVGWLVGWLGGWVERKY